MLKLNDEKVERNLSEADTASSLYFTLESRKFTSKIGLAIKGYDPVAYFNEQNALEGNYKYTLDRRGSKWKFISQNNLDNFKAPPGRYAPQYVGFVLMAPVKTTCLQLTPKYGFL